MDENISVLMSVYNEKEEHLKLSVESILNQDYRNFELIIVFDNPENLELRETLGQMVNDDRRVRLIDNESNEGLVASLNRAFSLASGDYIARMDADDYAYPDRFSRQLRFLKENKHDFVFNNVSGMSEDGTINRKQIFPQKSLHNQDVIKELMGIRNFSIHPTWFMKREVMERLNGYRNVASAEDYDFIIRSLREDFSLGYDAKVELSYRFRTNSISRTNALRQFRVNYILQNGLHDTATWEHDSINQINELVINKESEIKFGRFLTAGVFLKHSINIKNVTNFILRSILYPKGWLYAIKQMKTEKMFNSVFDRGW